MRYIEDTIQVMTDDVDTEGRKTKRPFGVRQLLRHMLRTSRSLNSDWEGMKILDRIEKALEGTGPIAIESGDWDRVCAVLKNPDPFPQFMPYPLHPASQCLPLVQATLEAETRVRALPQQSGRRK